MKEIMAFKIVIFILIGILIGLGIYEHRDKQLTPAQKKIIQELKRSQELV